MHVCSFVCLLVVIVIVVFDSRCALVVASFQMVGSCHVLVGSSYYVVVGDFCSGCCYCLCSWGCSCWSGYMLVLLPLLSLICLTCCRAEVHGCHGTGDLEENLMDLA